MSYLCNSIFLLNSSSPHKASLKVIRFDPLAPVITMALLLPVEWKMLDFIGNSVKNRFQCL